MDAFGRALFSKTLTTAFKGLKGVPVIGASTASRSSSVSTSAGRKINWATGKAQKMAFFDDVPDSEISITVHELRKGSSKVSLYKKYICYFRLFCLFRLLLSLFCFFDCIVSPFKKSVRLYTEKHAFSGSRKTGQ